MSSSAAGPDSMYYPGAGLALVGERCVLILPSQAVALAERCWPLVRRGAPDPAILDELAGDAAIAVSDFALAWVGERPGGDRIVVRGRGVVEVRASDGSARSITAGALSTPFEAEVDAASVRIGFDVSLGASGRSFPIGVGMVWADTVVFVPPARPFAGFPTDRPAATIIPPATVDPPATVGPFTTVGPMTTVGPFSTVGPMTTVGSPLPVAEPVASGPVVHAVVCARGHLCPPYAPHCRVCGEPVPPQEPFVTARPVLGLLRLSTGDVIALDLPVVLGRSPQAVALSAAGEAHLVALPSRGKDISRSHVEVRVEDWNILVTDLGSTNGTTVTVPGHPPIRLRANEPMPIEANTEVNLADEVVFRFEVTP